MFTLLATTWLIGSIAMISYALLMRRRRSDVARQLHEVRGALTSARLAIDLLPATRRPTNEAQTAAASELDRSARSLGDLETLFRRPLISAASGTGGRSSAPFDLHAEVERLAMIWGEAARRQGREFRFAWQGERDGVIARFDRRAFIEVVANLLSNALRHGVGTVELTARVRSDSLRIEVVDAGCGLPGPLFGVPRRPHPRRHGQGMMVVRSSVRTIGATLRLAPVATETRFILDVPALHNTAQAARQLRSGQSA